LENLKIFRVLINLLTNQKQSDHSIKLEYSVLNLKILEQHPLKAQHCLSLTEAISHLLKMELTIHVVTLPAGHTHYKIKVLITIHHQYQRKLLIQQYMTILKSSMILSKTKVLPSQLERTITRMLEERLER
jgi:hypothetical protein